MSKQEALNTINLNTQKLEDDLINRIVNLNQQFYHEDARSDVRDETVDVENFFEILGEN